MIRINNRGFFVVETFAVITIVIIVLVLFYQQTATMLFNYEESFQYDPVQTIHTANNLKIFILKEDIPNLISALDEMSYLEITDYEFSRPLFYEALKARSNIKQVYLMPFNINDFINNFYPANFDPLLIDYLRKLKTVATHNTSHLLRLVISFNNDTYTNIIIDINEEL